MRRTVTKRALSIAGAAVIGGLLSLAAVAQSAKIINIIGSSPTSWEEAAKNALDEAGKHLAGARTAEVGKLDLRTEDGLSGRISGAGKGTDQVKRFRLGVLT